MTDEQLRELAVRHVGRASLEAKNNDGDDFVDMHVSNIKALIQAAYKLGANSK